MNKILLSLLALSLQVCSPAFPQSYIKGPALIEGVTSTVTAAGTTTLTKDSQTVQVFTGSTTQTVVLPNATTLPVGRYFEFYNLSTGVVTVYESGGGPIRGLAASEHAKITLIANGTAAGTWAVEIITIALTSSYLTGTLPISKGGTGQTTANAAFNALAPTQTSNSGKFLTTNGTDTSWATVDALPSQTGNSGKLLTTNGTVASWLTATDVGLPSQTGNSGKFLTTNGTTTSWGTAALTAQGQDEGSGVTTTTIKAPHNQLTTTGTNERLIETGYNNFLANPSFEHSTYSTSWGALGDTTPAVETTVVRHGKKSAKLTTNAQSGNFWFQSVTPTIQMSGMNLEHGMAVKTSQSGVQVCALNAGSVVGTCQTVLSDNAWHYYTVNYPGPSSGSVGVTLYHASGVTGDIYADDAYVGKARNIGNVAQAYFFGGMEQAGATNCTYSENTSTGLTDFKDLGTGSGCNAWSTSGSLASVGTNDHRITASNMAAGMYHISINANFYSSVASQSCIFRLNDGTNTYQPQSIFPGSATNASISVPMITFHVPYTTAQSSITFKLQAADDGSGDCRLANGAAGQNASWKIYYFPSGSQTVVRMDQSNYSLTPYTATLSGFHGSTTQNLAHSRSGQYLKIQGRITMGGAASGNLTISLPSGLSIDNTYGNRLGGGFSTGTLAGSAGAVHSGVPIYASATTFSAYGDDGSGQWNATVPGTWQANDTLDVNVEIPIVGWTSNQNAPLLAGGVTSSSAGMERVERAFINGGTVSTDCSSSPCTITSQSGSWLSSVTRSTTGTYVLNIASGTFSAQPNCSGSAETGAAYGTILQRVSAGSATSVTILTPSSPTTLADMRMSVTCQGPR